MRQAWLDYGGGFQVKVLQTFELFHPLSEAAAFRLTFLCHTHTHTHIHWRIPSHYLTLCLSLAASTLRAWAGGLISVNLYVFL